MDVLQYWRPNLDQERLIQGRLSADFWHCFFDLIELSHAIRHWTNERNEANRKASRIKKGGWQAAAAKAETHEMRARHLAAEKVWRLGELIHADADRDLAIRIVELTGLTQTLRSHETANFAPIAIDAFDGSL